MSQKTVYLLIPDQEGSTNCSQVLKANVSEPIERALQDVTDFRLDEIGEVHFQLPLKADSGYAYSGVYEDVIGRITVRELRKCLELSKSMYRSGNELYLRMYQYVCQFNRSSTFFILFS